MVYVYVLRSKTSQIYYVGISEDVSNRLNQHNNGKSKFTKGYIPWELIYFEETSDYVSARKREKYLKSAAGKRWLKNKLDKN